MFIHKYEKSSLTYGDWPDAHRELTVSWISQWLGNSLAHTCRGILPLNIVSQNISFRQVYSVDCGRSGHKHEHSVSYLNTNKTMNAVQVTKIKKHPPILACQRDGFLFTDDNLYLPSFWIRFIQMLNHRLASFQTASNTTQALFLLALPHSPKISPNPVSSFPLLAGVWFASLREVISPTEVFLLILSRKALL